MKAKEMELYPFTNVQSFRIEIDWDRTLKKKNLIRIRHDKLIKITGDPDPGVQTKPDPH